MHPGGSIGEGIGPSPIFSRFPRLEERKKKEQTQLHLLRQHDSRWHIFSYQAGLWQGIEISTILENSVHKSEWMKKKQKKKKGKI